MGVGYNVNIAWTGGVDPPIGDVEYLTAFRWASWGAVPWGGVLSPRGFPVSRGCSSVPGMSLCPGGPCGLTRPAGPW